MDEHAIRTLEFDKIRAKLARHTAFSAGRDLALALEPSTDHAEVVRLQRLTAETRHLLRLKPRTGLAGAHDARPLAEKAARGGVLTPAELLDIGATLACARDLRSSIVRLDEQLPLLSDLASTIEPLRRLIDDVDRCINQRAEVTDQASPALGAIRREVRILHDRLYTRLEELLATAMSRGIAQEPIITLRDGRYVIPVKAEMRGQLRGIVHDVSGSGATVWLEPLALVDLGNKWREAQLEEEHEVERILRRLSGDVGHVAAAIEVNVATLAEIDLMLAKARFGDEIGAHELPYEGADQPWILPAPAQLHLLLARHPLLKSPVPTTLTVGGAYDVLLITGPNTGGKTVALKTAGLLALMAQAGLPVPADEGSRVPVFDSVFADIGDEQSIEQSLSTFSSHMTNIIRIVENAGRKSLVLLDELAAGTDPAEGAALARAILGRLLELGALTVATTHHGELKAYAHTAERVINASVEFNLEKLSPTYHLSIGLPGRSNALEIAQRLGMPPDLVEAARSTIAPDQLQVEEMLSDIRREREAAADARRSEQNARHEAEDIRDRLAEKLDAADDERARLIERAQSEIEADVASARMRLAEAEQEIERQRLAVAAAKLKQAADEAAVALAAKRQARPPRRRRQPRIAAVPHSGPPAEEIQEGDLVWIRGMDRWGEALGEPDERGEVEIRLGALHSRIKLAQVERVQRPAPSQAHGEVTANLAPSGPVSIETDVRGQTVDEAMPIIERYIDDAFRAGLPWTRIIHGKGTGALRREVRNFLARNPLVKSYEEAPPHEGGAGVTIAHLAL